MRGHVLSGVFAHTPAHVDILQGYVGPPVRSLGVLWGGGGEHARKQGLGDKERGRNLERHREVIEGATKNLHLPCWSVHQ